MKILVIGAGVLGSYLAHVLHCAGHAVTLLARGNRLSVMPVSEEQWRAIVALAPL